MAKLLVIMAHPHTNEKGLSVQVGEQFISSYRQSHPNDEIVIRDLFEEQIPPLDDTTFDAWLKVKYSKPMSEAEKNQLAQHTAWVDEFVSADKYVFVNPMYNHFLPYQLKNYLDVTAVTRKTFKYTDHGPEGLLNGKKALHIQAAGGIYHDNNASGEFQADFGDSYMDHMFSLYGIKNISKIFIEGCDQFPQQRDKILNNAIQQAKSMAQEF
ncbi:FMN-dependent NADH-azoreductase [Paucilactobacillus suebicus]|nr:FMN-dependent NADH-azoreductase [Paucilactobacillus suebicus]